MRDTRAERKHRKKVKRARWWKYHKHRGGIDHHQVNSKGEQGPLRSSTEYFWAGTDGVRRDKEYYRIQEKKEAQRQRRAREKEAKA